LNAARLELHECHDDTESFFNLSASREIWRCAGDGRAKREGGSRGIRINVS
jgi:hypothetical protein